MADYRYFADTTKLSNVFEKDGKFFGSPEGYKPVWTGTAWERGTVQANRVVRYKTSPSRHECDARCVNATGRTMNCECACGGKNHGAGFSSAPAF